jgi:hypothetical protein
MHLGGSRKQLSQSHSGALPSNAPIQPTEGEEEDEFFVIPKKESHESKEREDPVAGEEAGIEGNVSRRGSATLLPSESAASIRSKAETMAETTEEIDFQTFCLLTHRLMILLEQ